MKDHQGTRICSYCIKISSLPVSVSSFAMQEDQLDIAPEQDVGPVSGARSMENITLAEQLNASVVEDLHASLLHLQGRPVSLDASGVRQAGTLAMQLLVSGARQWRADNQPFSIVNASDIFLAATETLGLGPHLPIADDSA